MINNKKGVELSMNVIIIAILVILVLVVVAMFFLGGMRNLLPKFGQVSTDNIDLAISDCQSKCQLAQSLAGDNAKKSSGYCRKEVALDKNGDDIADQMHRCWSDKIGVECPGVQTACDVDSFRDLETS